MNELIMNGDRRMTVREVAEVLGVDESTVQRHIKAIRANSGNVAGVEHGKTTYLNEAEVTEIKMRIERSGRNDLENVAHVAQKSTELEMMMLDAKVSEWKNRRIAELQQELKAKDTQLAIAAPKAAAADRIASADGLKSLSEIGKINGIGPRKIFEILDEARIIYRSGKNWVPYQQYVDAGYFIVRESTYEMNGIDHLYSKTYVTGKGEVWLAGHLFVDHVLVADGNHEH